MVHTCNWSIGVLSQDKGRFQASLGCVARLYLKTQMKQLQIATNMSEDSAWRLVVVSLSVIVSPCNRWKAANLVQYQEENNLTRSWQEPYLGNLNNTFHKGSSWITLLTKPWEWHRLRRSWEKKKSQSCFKSELCWQNGPQNGKAPLFHSHECMGQRQLSVHSNSISLDFKIISFH